RSLRSRAAGGRGADRRGRHAGDRPVCGSLRRSAGGRSGERMKELLFKPAQPLPRGEGGGLRGLTRPTPLEVARAARPPPPFTGTTFNAPVTLRNVVFQGLAWFTDCTFNAVANFSGSRFLSDARFDKVRLRRGATFSGVEFHGVACFDEAEFGDASFLDRMTC